MTDDPRIDPADLRNVRFPGSSRRYDARAVDQFLETVATRITATNVFVDELRAQLAQVQDAPAPPLPAPAPSDLSLLDDDALVRLVGEETASVLSTARRAAEEIRSKAEESAARMIREATVEADRLSEEARARAAALTAEAEGAHARATSEAEEAAIRIRDEASAEAERLTAQARDAAEAQQAELEARRADAAAEVEEILQAAREEGRGMVAEAREVRSRILEDLQRRRDAARAQVERLLEGRDRLLAAYAAVRENLDDITGELADALPVPAEPDLPDGFAGVVGTDAPTGEVADHSGEDAAPAGDVAHEDADAVAADVTAAEPDDTRAPTAAAPEPEAEVEDEDEDEADEADEAPADESPVEEADAGADAGGGDDDERGSPAEEARPIAAMEDEPVEQQAGDEPTTVEHDEPMEADAGEGPAGDVDALFARLRAEREQSVAKAQAVLAAAPAPVAESADEPADEQGDHVDDEPGGGGAPGAAPAAEGGTETAPAGDVDRVPEEFLADEALLARRADALGPLADGLHRALKRRLADEQNELLDLLRRSGSTDPDDLLPDEAEQVQAYARIAEHHLAAAAGAGLDAGGGADGTAVDVAELADALGRNLVEPFRRRVERAAGDVDDADELDERLRALYREWKVQHVGPAADDGLLSAYARGTHAAAGGHGMLRWLIDPQQGPCPDAQDNALAGAVPVGDAFPTGDTCPQAHPGCRCLLVVGEA